MDGWMDGCESSGICWTQKSDIYSKHRNGMESYIYNSTQIVKRGGRMKDGTVAEAEWNGMET